MKKVSILFSRSLQKLLSENPGFEKLPVLEYALDTVGFFVGMAATKRYPSRSLKTLEGDEFAPNRKRFEVREMVELFTTTYRLAGRIEASIDTEFPDNVWGRVDWWTPGTCLTVRITFFKPGSGAPKLLEVYVGVDSSAARKYSISSPSDDRIRLAFCRTVHSCVR